MLACFGSGLDLPFGKPQLGAFLGHCSETSLLVTASPVWKVNRPNSTMAQLRNYKPTWPLWYLVHRPESKPLTNCIANTAHPQPQRTTSGSSSKDPAHGPKVSTGTTNTPSSRRGENPWSDC